MKLQYCLAALSVICCIMQTTASEEQAALSIYVHEGSLNGSMISGVHITGKDPSGKEFQGTTDENGVAVIKTKPGDCNFTFRKDGYKDLSIEYEATQTENVAAYLEKSASKEPVELTVYVHEGNLNGTLLSGVKIVGTDSAGGKFDETTDQNGAAVIRGTPGSWDFAFSKKGYKALYLNYRADETKEAAAYLEKDA